MTGRQLSAGLAGVCGAVAVSPARSLSDRRIVGMIRRLTGTTDPSVKTTSPTPDGDRLSAPISSTLTT
ncbi:MAG: hypothetical protein AAGC56_00500 [Pseudomonadota bacterium]